MSTSTTTTQIDWSKGRHFLSNGPGSTKLLEVQTYLTRLVKAWHRDGLPGDPAGKLLSMDAWHSGRLPSGPLLYTASRPAEVTFTLTGLKVAQQVSVYLVILDRRKDKTYEFAGFCEGHEVRGYYDLGYKVGGIWAVS